MKKLTTTMMQQTLNKQDRRLTAKSGLGATVGLVTTNEILVTWTMSRILVQVPGGWDMQLLSYREYFARRR